MAEDSKEGEELVKKKKVEFRHFVMKPVDHFQEVFSEIVGLMTVHY